MTEAENIRNVRTARCRYDWFYLLPQISPLSVPDARVSASLRQARRVFVNESKENILMYTDRFGLDYIQLHGNEAPEYCRSLRNAGLHLIKAFLYLAAQGPACRICLQWSVRLLPLRHQTPQYGGSGNQFDWNLLHRYNGPTPFLLSGGINPLQRKKLREFRHPYFAGIDINSRFETAPGIKGCGTHLKLPERTEGVYYLTIYDLPCTILAIYNLRLSMTRLALPTLRSILRGSTKRTSTPRPSTLCRRVTSFFFRASILLISSE